MLAESLAINLYLAKKHGKLEPQSLEDEAQTLRWSFWVMSAVEATLLDVLLKSRGLRGQEKDLEAGKGWHRGVAAALRCAEWRPVRTGTTCLATRSALPISMSRAYFAWARAAGIDFAKQPHLDAWLDRCLSREAAVRARR